MWEDRPGHSHRFQGVDQIDDLARNTFLSYNNGLQQRRHGRFIPGPRIEHGLE